MGYFPITLNEYQIFRKKIKPLILADRFPLRSYAEKAFQRLKAELAGATLQAVNEKISFVIETDSSYNAISATMNQESQPVIFFSIMLSKSEQQHSSIEKEAAAIVESLRKWSHFLKGQRFSIITDQKSVSFMHDVKNWGKIKNDKVLRWRMELSEFDFDII